jgi:hypothetical protein
MVLLLCLDVKKIYVLAASAKAYHDHHRQAQRATTICAFFPKQRMSIMFLQIYGSSELLSTPPQKMGLFRFVDCFPYIFNLDSSLQHSNQPLFLFSLLSLPWPLYRHEEEDDQGGWWAENQ